MSVSSLSSSDVRVSNVIENKNEQSKELSEQELAQAILEAAKAGKLEVLQELKKKPNFKEVTPGKLLLAQFEASKQGHQAVVDFLKDAALEKAPELTPGKMLLVQHEMSKLKAIKA